MESGRFFRIPDHGFDWVNRFLAFTLCRSLGILQAKKEERVIQNPTLCAFASLRDPLPFTAAVTDQYQQSPSLPMATARTLVRALNISLASVWPRAGGATTWLATSPSPKNLRRPSILMSFSEGTFRGRNDHPFASVSEAARFEDRIRHL
jgi:hypothetical protein